MQIYKSIGVYVYMLKHRTDGSTDVAEWAAVAESDKKRGISEPTHTARLSRERKAAALARRYPWRRHVILPARERWSDTSGDSDG